MILRLPLCWVNSWATPSSVSCANAFFQLFGLHRVLVHQFLEQLGREAGDAGEIEVLAFGERIADLEVAGIEQAHHVAGEGIVHDILFTRQEAVGVGKPHIFIQPHVVIEFIPLKLAGAHAQERDTVAVAGIEVGVDLEHEAGEFIFTPLLPRGCWPRGRAGWGRSPRKCPAGPLHRSCLRRCRRTRGQLAFQVRLFVELVIHAFDQLHVVAQLRGVLRVEQLVHLRAAAGRPCGTISSSVALLVGRERHETFIIKVIHPLEILSAR